MRTLCFRKEPELLIPFHGEIFYFGQHTGHDRLFNRVSFVITERNFSLGPLSYGKVAPIKKKVVIYVRGVRSGGEC